MDSLVKKHNLEIENAKGRTDDEIVAWMRQVMLYVKEVQDEAQLCKNSKEELEKYREEMKSILLIYEPYLN